MPDVDRFSYFVGDYGADQDKVFDQIKGAGADLVIVEAGNTSRAIGNTLSTKELQSLGDAGYTVVAYVNAAVPDANRSYWPDTDEAQWVIPDPADPEDLDYGTVTDAAPDWLQNAYGTTEGFEPGGDGIFGYIVDFTDPDWRRIVIDQAVELVAHGYHGIHFDDVIKYFDAGSAGQGVTVKEAAREMMRLVTEAAAAIHDIDPQAYISVNGGAYLRWDAAPSFGNAQAWKDFLQVVDGLMGENYFRDGDQTFWTDAVRNYQPTTNPHGIDFLAVEWASDLTAAEQSAFRSFATNTGLLAHVNANGAYDTPPAPGAVTADAPVPRNQSGTRSDDILLGTRAANRLDGRAGDDSLVGGDGADRLIGRGGSDRCSVDMAPTGFLEEVDGTACTAHPATTACLAGNPQISFLAGRERTSCAANAAVTRFLAGAAMTSSLGGERTTSCSGDAVMIACSAAAGAIISMVAAAKTS